MQTMPTNPFAKIWKNILTYDIEAQNKEEFGRFASQFCAENWVVAIGYSYNGGDVYYKYYHTKESVPVDGIMPDISQVNLIVGHNIKYDLLWVWGEQAVTDFLTRGGEIWDTQYAEYLLAGMVEDYHMNAMNDIAERYGGGCKLDAVKEMWEAGILTADIPKDLLLEYLVGSKHYGKPDGHVVGDVQNTWLIFCGQMLRVPDMHPNFLTMCRARMDGMLATTEMEWNGIYCDKQLGTSIRVEVQDTVDTLLKELNSCLPLDLPPALDFNWGSNVQLSAFIFGGTIAYKEWTPHLDAEGHPLYSNMTVKYPLFRGTPVEPKYCTILPSGVHLLQVTVPVEGCITAANGNHYLMQDTVAKGVNRGAPRFRNISMPNLDKPKGAKVEYYYTLPRQVEPDERWKGAQTDAAGQPIYSTNAKVIERLMEYDIPALKAFVKWTKAVKDMESYYWKADKDGNPVKGMLTLVNDENIIHHSLNHTSTVTGRLSSSKPNMQTMPKGGMKADGTRKGSRVKEMLRSRFGDDGLMAEIDYSQLEVVNQGVLTGDAALIADLNNKVDFHIKRLAFKLDRDYEELWKLHHVNEDPEIGDERTDAKRFSFQRQYGASVFTISYDTGIPLEDVKKLAAADEAAYPGVKKFDEYLEYVIESGAYPSGKFKFIAGERVPMRQSHWDCETGTRYAWQEHETPDWLAAKGKVKGFSPTERKNYPMQGLGGEVMIIMLGKVFRYFLANKRFNGNVLLVNTVHDCAWLDGRKGWLEPIAKNVATILEAVPQVYRNLFGMNIQVKYPVELEVGSNMYDMHVVKH